MSYPVPYKRDHPCGQNCRCGAAIPVPIGGAAVPIPPIPISFPHFDPDICNFMKEYGKNLVYDDRHDIYKIITKKHPHVGHHWISGSFMVVVGEMGNIMSKLGMFMQEFSERENSNQPLANIMNNFIGGMVQELPPEIERSYHTMREGIKGERAIPLRQLQEEAKITEKKSLLSAPKPPDLKKYD